MIARKSSMTLPTKDEQLFIGIDVSKETHLVSFVSESLLAKFKRHTACPTFEIKNTRAGFEHLVREMQCHAQLGNCSVLLEKTGHYHFALRQYLQERGIPVFELHVQKRLSKIKNDRRDAQSLANLLYNQIHLGVQVNKSEQEARRVPVPTETAQALRVLTRRRYELTQSTTRIKNKLTAITDELFPEAESIISDLFGVSALAIFEKFPTPQAIAEASFDELCACRHYRRPGDEDLHRLQELARASIGTRTPGRTVMLAIEQRQLIAEYRLLCQQLTEIEDQIATLVEESREGQILLSMGVFGPNQAATFLAVIGSIENVESASKLKGLAGWHPVQSQTGTSTDSMVLSKGGNRILRHTLFLVGMRAVRGDSGEWRALYERLIPRMCQKDDRIGCYRGKKKPLGHVIGRILCVAYALLRKDHDAVVAAQQAGRELPPPTLYDREIHARHRNRRQP